MSTEKPGVMELIGELAGATLDLAHNTVQLAASEARVVVRRLAARLGLLFLWIVVSSVGILLVLGGGALLLASATGMPQWLAFVSVGALTSSIGGLFALRALRRLNDPDLGFEATLGEIAIDVEKLRAARTQPVLGTSSEDR